MARRRTTARIPIWVRVSGITALLLTGVVVSSMLLGASGVGGHGSGDPMRGPHNGSSQMGGMDHSGCPTAQASPNGHIGTDHGGGSQMARTDHNGCPTEPAAPEESELPENQRGP